MENNPDTNTEINHSDNNGNIYEQTDVEYTPKLFSEENNFTQRPNSDNPFTNN